MTLPANTFAEQYTVTRGGNATVRGSNGALADIAASTPRLQFASAGVPQGILIEGVGTNLALNPRWLGVVAGTPPSGSPPSGGTAGTGPTGWGFSNTTFNSQTGLNYQLGAVQTIDGEDVLPIRIFGTSGGNLFTAPLAAAVSVLAASPFDVLMNYRLLAGTTAGLTQLAHSFAIPSGATVPSNSVHASLGAAPVEARATKAAGAGIDGTSTVNLRLQFATATPIDITIGLSLLRVLRDGRVTQSPIRPLAGNAGPATRSRDQVDFRSVNWWNPARMLGGVNVGTTAMFEFTPQQVGVAGDQGLLRLDDGMSNNRMEAYILSGTNQVWVRRVIAGAAQTTQIGTVSGGSRFRLILAATSTEIVALLTGGQLTAIPINGGTFVPVRGLLGSVTNDDTTAFFGVCGGTFSWGARFPNKTLFEIADLAFTAAQIRSEGGAP